MTLFKQIVRLRILALLALALYAIIAPDKLMEWFGEENAPIAWVQALGAMLIFVAFGYAPSAIAPSRVHIANMFPLIAPVIPAALFIWIGGPFLWLALFEIAFLFALHLSFRRDAVRWLMARP
jgi:hypothetical protein